MSEANLAGAAQQEPIRKPIGFSSRLKAALLASAIPIGMIFVGVLLLTLLVVVGCDYDRMGPLMALFALGLFGIPLLACTALGLVIGYLQKSGLLLTRLVSVICALGIGWFPGFMLLYSLCGAG